MRMIKAYVVKYLSDGVLRVATWVARGPEDSD